MTAAIAVFIYVYLFVGFIFGVLLDRWQMKKDIPYAELPSIFSLDRIRKNILIICTVFGFPLLIFGVAKATIVLIRMAWEQVVLEVRFLFWQWRIKRLIKFYVKLVSIKTKLKEKQDDGNSGNRII